MPVYEAECPSCGGVLEYVQPVSQCLETPECTCGVRMQKVIFSVPRGYVRGKFEAFKSSVDGTIIANHRDMTEHNRRNGVVCVADGYSDEKVRSGSFAKKAVKTDKADINRDLAEAAVMVRDGYKPQKLEVHDVD